MISILLEILLGLVAIFAIGALLYKFVPMLWEWLTWSLDAANSLLHYFPSWLLPIFLVCIVLALIGWGVKLL